MKKLPSLFLFVLLFQVACSRFGFSGEVTPIAATNNVTSTTLPVKYTSTAQPSSTSTLTPKPTKTSTPTQTPTPTPPPTITPTPTLEAITSSNINHLKEIYRIGKGKINGLSWWPDDQTLAVTTYAGIFLHDGDTFEETTYIEPPGNITPFYISLGPDGHTVASSDGDNLIHVWNASTRQITHVLDGHPNQVNSLTISPDSTMLASIHTPYEVRILRLWDLLTGENVYTIEGDHHNWGKVKFNQDGTLLVTTGLSTKCIQIWDVNSGDILWTYERTPTYETDNIINFSPNGRFLAFIGRDGTIRVFAACDQECPDSQANQ